MAPKDDGGQEVTFMVKNERMKWHAPSLWCSESKRKLERSVYFLNEEEACITQCLLLLVVLGLQRLFTGNRREGVRLKISSDSRAPYIRTVHVLA